VAKLAELRGAGLSAKAAFLILQSFSKGQVTHLLRANHEASGWSKQFDEVLVSGVQLLVGSSLDDEQRRQVFLRLADGGLGFGSCELACEAAFLASWALTLKDVAECLGITSWESFRNTCQPVAESIDRAEARLLACGGGDIKAVGWVSLLSEPRSKLQGFWSSKLRQRLKDRVLRDLSPDDQVDLRSAGSPGAGGRAQKYAGEALPDNAARPPSFGCVPSWGFLQTPCSEWNGLLSARGW